MGVAEVLAGTAQWGVECADAVAFLNGIPDDSIDLLFTSPPYRMARTYGIDAGRDTEEWTAWMMDFVRAAAPKVKGLIAINCDGQTKDYRYHPTPYLLIADLHRAGFNLRRPAFFHRIGIPGSGGPDWLRADMEPVVCITRPGALPWSDNTACGHPPRWAPGGEMSNRTVTGQRVNQAYLPPVLANPGNVIRQTFTTDEVAELLGQASEIVHTVVGGGGKMGSNLASENEAPFPVALAAFFMKSFCPPNGIVCDPFTGSSTTGHAALDHGRRFIGCDIRESQVALSTLRLRGVTPVLFIE